MARCAGGQSTHIACICRGCGCYLYMITTCLHVVYVPLYMLKCRYLVGCTGSCV